MIIKIDMYLTQSLRNKNLFWFIGPPNIYITSKEEVEKREENRPPYGGLEVGGGGLID